MQTDVCDGARLARDAIDTRRATEKINLFDAMRGAWPIYERSILRYFTSALTDDETASLDALLAKLATGLA